MSSIEDRADQGQPIDPSGIAPAEVARLHALYADLLGREAPPEVGKAFAVLEARIVSRVLARIEQVEAEAKAQAEQFMSPDGMMKMAEQFLGVPPVPGR